MRLLHTSDWHLGRRLHQADLRDAQAAFADHLVETVRAQRVDVVVVAGDVFDRAVPPVDAVELCEQGLVRLRDAGARVVVISGNHDSARRLGFAGPLLDAAGVHLRTRVGSLTHPVMLGDEHGQVAVYGLPYLEPAVVDDELPAEPAAPLAPADAGRGHAGVLGRAVRAVRADLAARPGARSVVLAHAWVAGGLRCDSERDISVGGVGAVPAGLFDGFDYVALGHLHGQQTLAPGLRYSGSPLAYSFSEAGHVKGSWLVELGPFDSAVRAEFVPAPVRRALTVLRGPLDDLLTEPGYRRHERDFVSVTLTDPTRPEQAMDALRRRFPHVLQLAFEPAGAAVDGLNYRARVAGRDDVAVAAEFVRHVRGAPAAADERALLARAFESVRVAAAGERQPATESESGSRSVDVVGVDSRGRGR